MTPIAPQFAFELNFAQSCNDCSCFPSCFSRTDRVADGQILMMDGGYRFRKLSTVPSVDECKATNQRVLEYMCTMGLADGVFDYLTAHDEPILGERVLTRGRLRTIENLVNTYVQEQLKVTPPPTT